MGEDELPERPSPAQAASSSSGQEPSGEANNDTQDVLTTAAADADSGAPPRVVEKTAETSGDAPPECSKIAIGDGSEGRDSRTDIGPLQHTVACVDKADANGCEGKANESVVEEPVRREDAVASTVDLANAAEKDQSGEDVNKSEGALRDSAAVADDDGATKIGKDILEASDGASSSGCRKTVVDGGLEVSEQQTKKLDEADTLAREENASDPVAEESVTCADAVTAGVDAANAAEKETPAVVSNDAQGSATCATSDVECDGTLKHEEKTVERSNTTAVDSVGAPACKGEAGDLENGNDEDAVKKTDAVGNAEALKEAVAQEELQCEDTVVADAVASNSVEKAPSDEEKVKETIAQEDTRREDAVATDADVSSTADKSPPDDEKVKEVTAQEDIKREDAQEDIRREDAVATDADVSSTADKAPPDNEKAIEVTAQEDIRREDAQEDIRLEDAAAADANVPNIAEESRTKPKHDTSEVEEKIAAALSAGLSKCTKGALVNVSAVPAHSDDAGDSQHTKEHMDKPDTVGRKETSIEAVAEEKVAEQKAIGSEKSGSQEFAQGNADDGPLPRVAARTAGESWDALKASSCWPFPAATNEGEGNPDGSIRLRVFDGSVEVLGISITEPCIIFGSSLKDAHVADGTSESVKSQHAALVFVNNVSEASTKTSPADSYFKVQPINGEVRVSSTNAHAGVAAALRGERRTPRQLPVDPTVVGVGADAYRLDRQRCCFTLSRSQVVFFLDVLPSAEKVKKLGTARHVVNGIAGRTTRAVDTATDEGTVAVALASPGNDDEQEDGPLQGRPLGKPSGVSNGAAESSDRYKANTRESSPAHFLDRLKGSQTTGNSGRRMRGWSRSARRKRSRSPSFQDRRHAERRRSPRRKSFSPRNRSRSRRQSKRSKSMRRRSKSAGRKRSKSVGRRARSRSKSKGGRKMRSKSGKRAKSPPRSKSRKKAKSHGRSRSRKRSKSKQGRKIARSSSRKQKTAKQSLGGGRAKSPLKDKNARGDKSPKDRTKRKSPAKMKTSPPRTSPTRKSPVRKSPVKKQIIKKSPERKSSPVKKPESKISPEKKKQSTTRKSPTKKTQPVSAKQSEAVPKRRPLPSPDPATAKKRPDIKELKTVPKATSKQKASKRVESKPPPVPAGKSAKAPKVAQKAKAPRPASSSSEEESASGSPSPSPAPKRSGKVSRKPSLSPSSSPTVPPAKPAKPIDKRATKAAAKPAAAGKPLAAKSSAVPTGKAPPKATGFKSAPPPLPPSLATRPAPKAVATASKASAASPKEQHTPQQRPRSEEKRQRSLSPSSTAISIDSPSCSRSPSPKPQAKAPAKAPAAAKVAASPPAPASAPADTKIAVGAPGATAAEGRPKSQPAQPTESTSSATTKHVRRCAEDPQSQEPPAAANGASTAPSKGVVQQQRPAWRSPRRRQALQVANVEGAAPAGAGSSAAASTAAAGPAPASSPAPPTAAKSAAPVVVMEKKKKKKRKKEGDEDKPSKKQKRSKLAQDLQVPTPAEGGEGPPPAKRMRQQQPSQAQAASLPTATAVGVAPRRSAASSATSVVGSSEEEGGFDSGAPRAKAGARRRTLKSTAAGGTGSKDLLKQRLVATQKELLRLQLGAKARQLEQLRNRFSVGRGGRLSRFSRPATTALQRPAGGRGRAASAGVVPVAVIASPEKAKTTAALAAAPAAAVGIPTPAAAAAKPLQSSLRSTLHTVVQSHQDKVAEQRRKLEAAIARRQQILEASAAAKHMANQSTSDSAALPAADASASAGTRARDGKRLVTQ